MGLDISQISKKESKKSSGVKAVKDILKKDIKLFGAKLNDKKKEQFFSELGILLSSGIDIKTSLEIIVEEQKKTADKNIFHKIYVRVVDGDSLSDALNQSKQFGPYDFYSLKIGEETGKVAEVLTELQTFYSKKIKQKRQLVNALSYPVLVLTTALLAVIFMLNYLVPLFVDIFKRTNNELPAITKLIVNISDIFSAYLGYFFLILIIIFILLMFNRKTEWYRKFYSVFILKLPFIGKIFRMIYLERFFQSMALLIGSKVPLLRAVQLTKNMIGFYSFEKALTVIEDDILHGKALYESMLQFPLFARRIISLVKVGEEVNKLDSIFEKLNEQYHNELEHQINLLSSLLEPVLIIFIGVLVAIILIAMYLPMFQMGTAFY